MACAFSAAKTIRAARPAQVRSRMSPFVSIEFEIDCGVLSRCCVMYQSLLLWSSVLQDIKQGAKCRSLATFALKSHFLFFFNEML
jgi:hypothetical protein